MCHADTCCSETGTWPGQIATLGHAIATFDIMAQLLSHPLVDVAHVWTTRWRTGYPTIIPASSTDALQARPTLDFTLPSCLFCRVWTMRWRTGYPVIMLAGTTDALQGRGALQTPTLHRPRHACCLWWPHEARFSGGGSSWVVG